MSRSGYSEDLDQQELALYRGRVTRALKGKRGQSFLKELASEMDAMPVKELIAEELINSEGKCCAIGVVCKSRGLDVSSVDYEDSEAVGNMVGIAQTMAAEIEFINDDDFAWKEETPHQRWERVRKWISRQL